jgi:uncharacterized protein YnzC (UPF0291/DUF896 family)
MEKTLVPPPLQYIVKEDGQRIGVVLGWEDYQALQAMCSTEGDLLIGLSEPELRALADGMLSSRYQERLNELLRRNREGELSAEEEQELDRLLEQVDYMNLLKARAAYTLQQLGVPEAKETLDS